MRLGDLDAVKKRVGEFWFGDPAVELFVDDLVDGTPTVDAVPVVRCWNCGNGLRSVDGYVRCSHPAGKLILMKGSDFCSYGEQRKEAEGNV